MVSEGLATAFQEAAEPGPPAPFGHALTPAQECRLWKRARPRLGDRDLGKDQVEWMWGGKTVPRYTGYTIGYGIITAYRRHNPGVGWKALTTTPADKVLAGSRYRPCPT